MIAFSVCWLIIVAIPMAKVSREALYLLWSPNPLRLRVVERAHGDVLLCTYYAVNFGYFKYSVLNGFNVMVSVFHCCRCCCCC
jgi:hypothetical protein